MTNEPDQTVAEEGDSVVQEDAISDAPVAAPKAARKTARKPKTPAKKVASKRASKPKAPASKQRKTAAKPVAPAPPPLTLEELKEQGREAKRELISAVVEPAVEVVGSLSQTVRDTIGGAFAGLLSRKRRD
jgi:hypothetical protein